MKKIILLINLFLLFSLCIFAQNKENKTKEKPNFNGTWILDENKSFPDGSDRKNYENYFLVISLVGNELKINKNYDFKKENTNYNLILFADNRVEENVIPLFKDQNVRVISKTYWHKDTIIRESGFRADDINKSFNRVIERFRLSKDGNKLIINVSHSFEPHCTSRMPCKLSSPYLEYVTYKLVFRRKD